MTPDQKREARRNREREDPILRAKKYQYLKKWKQNNKTKWLGYKQKRYDKSPFLRLLSKAKGRAKLSGLEYSLTIEWARARWTGNCEITYAPFQKTEVRGRMRSFSPSLDRIDASKGYTQDNCRFILCAINRLKGDEDDETMFKIVRLLSGH